MEQKKKDEDATKSGLLSSVKRTIEKAYDTVMRDVKDNPDIAAENFLRKVSNEEDLKSQEAKTDAKANISIRFFNVSQRYMLCYY